MKYILLDGKCHSESICLRRTGGRISFFPCLLYTTCYLLMFLFTFATITLFPSPLKRGAGGVLGDLMGFSGIALAQSCTPTLLGSYNTPNFAEGVYVSGTTAYVADGHSGLQIINVSNPASPVLLGNYNTPDYARDVYVSGTTAYVAVYCSPLVKYNF